MTATSVKDEVVQRTSEGIIKVGLVGKVGVHACIKDPSCGHGSGDKNTLTFDFAFDCSVRVLFQNIPSIQSEGRNGN